jgi:hypothetical protein
MIFTKFFTKDISLFSVKVASIRDMKKEENKYKKIITTNDQKLN